MKNSAVSYPAENERSVSGAGRKSGGAERSVKRAWQKTIERELEVAERERSGERAEWPLTARSNLTFHSTDFTS